MIGGEKKEGFDEMMTDEWMINDIRELKKEGVFEFVCNIVILPILPIFLAADSSSSSPNVVCSL